MHFPRTLSKLVLPNFRTCHDVEMKTNHQRNVFEIFTLPLPPAPNTFRPPKINPFAALCVHTPQRNVEPLVRSTKLKLTSNSKESDENENPKRS